MLTMAIRCGGSVAAACAARCRAWWALLRAERGAEVPEYVLVVAVIAMLAVGGLVAVKAGLASNLSNIASCLSATAGGSATSCS
jgi:Flp pilus assembly pilin Flp